MTKTVSLHFDELYAQLKDSRIMLVDDEPVLMEILQAFLEDSGYSDFLAVEDSRKAMTLMSEERPDILLLDLKMPHVDGFEILRAVRDNSGLQHMPVIVLTSSSDAETKLKALELGATDFLAKPVDASELALRIRNTLMVKAYQDQLTYYDTLTELPNRKLFLDRLTWLLQSAKRDHQRVAILDIRLDRFKEINDSLGPSRGDEVLKEVAQRLISSVRQSDVVTHSGSSELWRELARLGGDEFSIILPDLKQREGAVYVASRIQEALADEMLVDGTSVFISASIGVSVYPEDGEDPDVLLGNAGAATAFAKKEGPGTCQFYSAEINERAQQRLNTEGALRRAIEREEFVLHYQPKVAVADSRTVSCEALIRWQDPERGLVPPDQFIDIAEDTGLIVAIGEWVIQEACRQQAAWIRQGVGDFLVSVNVSGPQFRLDNLDETIESAARAAAMDPRRLNLEITESMLMGDADEFIRRLHRIRDIGPTFSIDDFGIGYSSLSYLKRFPISELKIDRSFVTHLPGDENDAAIVRAIIAMAHGLDLSVVAEGVEEAAQLEFLTGLDCDIIQGWYYSKAISAAEFAAFVAKPLAPAKPLSIGR